MSTNKTANYQLHLWEPGDDFLREEFNENNETLDAALKAQAEELDAAVAALSTEMDTAVSTLSTEMNTAVANAKQTAASALAAYKTSNDAAVASVRSEFAAQLDAALNEVMYREKLKELVTTADTSKYSIDLSDINFSNYWALEIYVEGMSSSGACYAYLNDASGSGYYSVRNSSGTSTTQAALATLSMATTENPKKGYSKFTLYCGTSVVNVYYQRFGESSTESRMYATVTSGVTWENLTKVTLGPYAEGVLQSGLTVTVYGIRK